MSGREVDLGGLLPAEAVAAFAPRSGVAVARLVALSETWAWVRLDGHGLPVGARSTVELNERDVDGEVVVAFEGDDPQKPIVLGRIRSSPCGCGGGLRAQVDGDRLVLSAKERIVLECGQASITLTSSGKVLIRGHYIQSRATGVNAIRGGSVELN